MKLSWANAKKAYTAAAAAVAAGVAQGLITGTAEHCVVGGLAVVAAFGAVYWAPKNAPAVAKPDAPNV